MDYLGLKTALLERCDKGDSAVAGTLGCVCCDSRRVQKGDVFVAVCGVNYDGHDFVAQAIARGASVVVCEASSSEIGGLVDVVEVANSQIALGELAQAALGQPSQRLKMLAVTGTNGKTTVAYLAKAMLAKNGVACGLVGTVEYDLGAGKVARAVNTTPGPIHLAQLTAEMRDNGLSAAVMECSSHGLAQDRTAGIDFDGAAFTNLSGDHYDYHGGRDAYLAAKGKLFSGLSAGAVAVLNGDDEVSAEFARLAKKAGASVWYYGFDDKWDICAEIISQTVDGCEFLLKIFGHEVLLRSPLIGKYNVSNCLAAAGLAYLADVGPDTIAKAIESFTGVPGRLERVDCGGRFVVLVDYAHTDDALSRVLETVKAVTTGRLLLVFGCGGQRDRSKRARMAKAAQQWADVIVVTNDNPRGEAPATIIEDIRNGFSDKALGKVVEILDRREAIGYALTQASQGDVVLIAGKGHEDYQIIGDERLAFDDREVVREIIV